MITRAVSDDQISRTGRISAAGIGLIRLDNHQSTVSSYHVRILRLKKDERSPPTVPPNGR